MQQFKIGDWVDYAWEFYRVHEEYNGKGNISKEVVNSLVRHDKNVKLWQPKEGEWCWFRDNRGEAALKQFSQMCPIVATNYILKQGLISGTVEPFIGELPTFLKDK